MNKTAFDPINLKIIIPARFNSSRFEGKLLQKIDGISILERVYNQAKLVKPGNLIIATDDERIEQCAKNFGAEVFFSKTTHQSGTQRVSELAAAKNWINDEIIINLQADEPFINPKHIKKLANYCQNNKFEMATLATKANENQLNDNNCVKLIKDFKNNAVYFSRSPIPALRFDHLKNSDYLGMRNKNLFRHIGIYAFNAAFLQKFTSYKECDLEVIESLEQLRALYYGHSIYVLEVKTTQYEIGIDDEKSFNQIKAQIENK